MVRKDGTTRGRGVKVPRPLKSSKRWQFTLSLRRYQSHHMLQPQLLQILQDPIPALIPNATSAVSITKENVGSSIAPVATEGDTLQGSAGLILPRIRVRETIRTTTTTTTAITTTPIPAATMQGLATPALGVEGRGISAEIALTTTQETEEQEEC